MIYSVEVKVFRETLRCDVCKSGSMVFTGQCLMVHPPWYVHQCDQCKNTYQSREVYPRIVYQNVDPFEVT